MKIAKKEKKFLTDFMVDSHMLDLDMDEAIGRMKYELSMVPEREKTRREFLAIQIFALAHMIDCLGCVKERVWDGKVAAQRTALRMIRRLISTKPLWTQMEIELAPILVAHFQTLLEEKNAENHSH